MGNKQSSEKKKAKAETKKSKKEKNETEQKKEEQPKQEETVEKKEVKKEENKEEKEKEAKEETQSPSSKEDSTKDMNKNTSQNDTATKPKKEVHLTIEDSSDEEEKRERKKVNKRVVTEDDIKAVGIPDDINEKLSKFLVSMTAINSQEFEMSTGRVHHFKPHAPLHDALTWLLEHDTRINGTVIFENNSSLMIVDGKYDSVDLDE